MPSKEVFVVMGQCNPYDLERWPVRVFLNREGAEKLVSRFTTEIDRQLQPMRDWEKRREDLRSQKKSARKSGDKALYRQVRGSLAQHEEDPQRVAGWDIHLADDPALPECPICDLKYYIETVHMEDVSDAPS